jgi:hypothetical protein
VKLKIGDATVSDPDPLADTRYADVRDLPDEVLETAAWAEHQSEDCGYCGAVRAEQQRRKL